MNQSAYRPVARRRVFYIPGYDPMPPRRYRELYRTEGLKQAEISGYRLAVKKRGGDAFGWMAKTDIEGQTTTASVEVLLWSDIVRDSMGAGFVATYVQLVRTAWIYLSTGTLQRLMWLRRGPIIAALYPIAMLLGQLLLAIVAGWIAGGWLQSGLMLLGGLAGAVLPDWLAGFWLWPALASGLGWALTAGLATWIIRRFRAMDHKLFAYYLMHDYAFTSKHAGRNPDVLDARMAEFAEKIGAALAEDVDEVLVVGHSSGAHLAVSILADLIRAGRVPANGPVLSLLTLGHVIPMVSFLPKADRLRADLYFMSMQDEVTWVDVSAPGDGCSFALCDPVAVTGLAQPEQKWPLVISAAFSQTLKRETFAKLKRRYFRLHFQYLCAFDNPGDYDYFQITGGPISLGQRFADRNPSRSRIDVPASRYRSMAA
jgi:hypothetical protein